MKIGAPSSARPQAGLRTVAQLPGPRGWPLLGHLPRFDMPRMHLQLEGWARRYGPMYRLRFLRTDVLVLSDDDLVAQAFRARPDTWRRVGSIETIAREAGVHGLFSAEGADWARQRRLVVRAFDPAHLRSFFPRLVVVTERLRRRWLRAADSGEALDVEAELMRFAVDAVTGLAFGVDINTVEQEHSDLNAHLETVLPMINRRLHAVFPYWRYVRLPADRAFERDLAAVHSMLRDLIAAAREQLARDDTLPAAPRNLLQALLVAHHQGPGANESSAPDVPLTEQEVIGNLFTVLLAGQDTTASTLAWILYLLSAHPHAWRRLVAEVDRAIPHDSAPGDLDTALALPFADACAAEAMRLHPVAPVHYMEACRDTSVSDVFVPRGTCLFCLTRMGANDAARVQAPHEFRPERWLDGGHAGELKHLSRPFGAGPRICPGRNLAMLEMRMVLSMLARNFERVEARTGRGQPPAEHLGFTMHPEPLRMRLARRQVPAGAA